MRAVCLVVLLQVRAAVDQGAVVVAVEEGPEEDNPEKGEEGREEKVSEHNERVPEPLRPLRPLCWCFTA